jgi:hypothetical protein
LLDNIFGRRTVPHDGARNRHQSARLIPHRFLEQLLSRLASQSHVSLPYTITRGSGESCMFGSTRIASRAKGF